MEFNLLGQFHHPEVPRKLKIRTQGVQLKLTQFLYVLEDEKLYVGLSNGQIYYWKPRNPDTKILNNQKESELCHFTEKDQHRGDITCLVYEQRLFDGMILSGSADSNVKIWVKDVHHKARIYKCCQTLVEHTGSILSIAVSGQLNVIATSSTDQTIRIWIQKSGRELLLYPFYENVQQLTEYLGRRFTDIGGMGLWIASMVWKEGDDLQLFAADSNGVINIFRPNENFRERQRFHLDRHSGQVHRLIINQIMLVPHENLIFTTSFDQNLKGLDATNGSEFVNMKNQNRCNFTSMVWDSMSHELIVGDEKGFIGVWNVYHERPVFLGRIFNSEQKIINLSLRDRRHELIVTTETDVLIYRMKREQSSHDLKGHTGPIIAIYAQETDEIHRIHSNNKPRFITTSIDNTLRTWDFGELDVQNIMEPPRPRSEITAMCFLRLSNLVATGHEAGEVMLWYTEINSHLLLKADRNAQHSNTVTAMTQAFHNQTEHLLTTGYDGRICIWEIIDESSANRQTKDNQVDITVFPTLRIFIDTTSRNQETGEDELLCIQYHRELQYIISAGNRGDILVLSFENNDNRTRLKGHEDAVTCLAMDGYLLFSGSDDKTIRVWNLQELQFPYLYSLSGHSQPVKDILMIPNSGNLLSCSHDGRLNLWKYTDQTIIKTFERADQLNCLAFFKTQNIILIGTEQCTIITIPITPELGNPEGLNHTINKADRHLDKKIRQRRGENPEMSDDTRSILSEEIKEEHPDPTEDLLKEMLLRQRKKDKLF